jgi:uncharacterized protein (TIGR02117 family)
MKPVLRGAAFALAGFVLLLSLYAALALLLGAIPRNAGFVESHDGIAVYVRTNGVHAELILPTRHGSVDWSAEFPSRHMRALPVPTDWIAFGWGDAAFMIETPGWADIHPTTALAALAGLGQGAMHVEYVETPTAYKARRVRLSAEEYARLVDYIRASFVRDSNGEPRQIDAPGYFNSDAFYEAVPSYTFWHTCNEWTRRALATAGVRTATWAPFDIAVMFHLPRPAAP